MLDDMLVEGTGGCPIPPEEKIRISTGPRVYATRIKQGRGDASTKPAYCFVGYPISEGVLDWIRMQSNLSNNYSAVFIPHAVLKGVNRNFSKGIVGDVCGCYVVRGLLPSKALRWDATLRDYLAKEKEEMVFASPEDFVGLKL